MSRAGARGVVVAAAVVAGVAGAAAVITAAALPAVVAGLASAVVAVLILVEDPESDDTPAAAPPPPAVALDPSAPERSAADDDLDVDPLQDLFEAGPPAGGSGLLSAEFVLTTLRGRMAVARRALRPLALVCFEAHETADGGVVGRPVPTDVIAAVLRRTLREADVSGHLEDHAYVCILEDTGEDGAVWTAERVRRNLGEAGHHRRFRAGVAAYPTHGLEPEELEAKAREALVAARDWSTDRIEVAGGA